VIVRLKSTKSFGMTGTTEGMTSNAIGVAFCGDHVGWVASLYRPHLGIMVLHSLFKRHETHLCLGSFHYHVFEMAGMPKFRKPYCQISEMKLFAERRDSSEVLAHQRSKEFPEVR
jgi:hypothetical protein